MGKSYLFFIHTQNFILDDRTLTTATRVGAQARNSPDLASSKSCESAHDSAVLSSRKYLFFYLAISSLIAPQTQREASDQSL